MNIDDLTIAQARQIAAMMQTNGTSQYPLIGPPPVVNKYCIVRAQKAGVHAGMVSSIDRDFVTLIDSRRMWKWFSGFTLSEAANDGIDASKSRIAAPVEILIIPTLDVGEIIPCSEKSKMTIIGAKNG